MQAAGEELRLVDLARRGGAEAFNQLVLLHQQTAYNVAYRLLGSTEAAADVTQDAFISAYEHIRSFRGGSFRSWLLRIVTNGCYDHLRAKQRRPATSLDEPMDDDESGFDPPDPGESPDRLALRRETIATIQRGLLTLPLEMRVAVVLYDVQGFGYDEIAEVTGVSLGTVKSRISRGRGHLRDFLRANRELL